MPMSCLIVTATVDLAMNSNYCSEMHGLELLANSQHVVFFNLMIGNLQKQQLKVGNE